MSTRLAAKKSAEGSDTEEESGLAEAVLNQEARLEGLRIAGEELEERLKRDLIASLKESEARQDVSAVCRSKKTPGTPRGADPPDWL